MSVFTPWDFSVWTIVGGAVGAGSGAAIGAGTGYGAKKDALIGGGAGAAAGAVYDILRNSKEEMIYAYRLT